MHLRISRVTRNGKTYEYCQLVESYRRETDGMPMHRVIGNLGRLAKEDVENLRAALAASRGGERVAVVPCAPTAPKPAKPEANLRYLDLAVLLELWGQWKLDEVLSPLMPAGKAEVAPAAVVAALAIQRCTDPASDLEASKWFARTALPELLGIPPESFNNTRLHRVLDLLEAAAPALMRKLPLRYQSQDHAFAAMFLDVSDTWFVGHGPAMAEWAKVKEGHVARKIGIVLMCNEHGYPLRWDVIRGRCSDSEAMTDILQEAEGLTWSSGVPVVCDRAMGRTEQIKAMLATGLHFLTALTVREYDSYSTTLPYAAFADLDPGSDEPQARLQCIAEAVQRAKQAGLHEEADDQFVLDLGLVQRAKAEDGELSSCEDEEGELNVRAMKLARVLDRAVVEGKRTLISAAAALGLKKGLAVKYRTLTRLPADIQAAVLEGKAAVCSLDDLVRIARLGDETKQREALAERLSQPRRRRAPKPTHSSPPAEGEPEPPLRVRAAAYFNPEMFVDQRLRARKNLVKVEAFAHELNRKLAIPRSRAKYSSIAAAVDQQLRNLDLLEAFDVRICESEGECPRYRVELTLKADEWARRRRYDGFCFLVAHPEIGKNAIELCRLYRAKNAVEVDFHVIKSLIKLRPIGHRLDAKVRAHVTICMLALLLERTLRRKLGDNDSSKAARETLSSCHLNRYASQTGPDTYSITRLAPEQERILRALGLMHLADDEDLTARMTPRTCL